MEAPVFNGSRLEALEKEFRESGKDIDTFLRDKLRESGRPDVAEGIIDTMSEIDTNDAEIQKAKADGYNRQDWLNRKFRALFRNVNSKFAGELLSRTSRLLRGLPEGKPEEAEFIGAEAIELVEELDESLEANVASQLAQESPAERE